MKKPITIDNDSVVSDVIRKLLDQKISRALVSKGDDIVGIITEKDLGFFLLTDSSERKLEEIRLSEVAKPLFSINESSSVKECAKSMLENGIGSLGVESEGDTVGIITKTDLAKDFAANCKSKKTVGEYMSPFYAWAYSDEKLSKIVSKMIDDKISRLVLRNHQDVPIGILSFRDLFRIALTQGQEENVLDNSDPVISVVFTRKGFLSDSGFGGTTPASDIMNDEITTVNYDDDLAEACDVMITNNINGVGVLSANGSLIGILSKTDIIKAIAFLN